MVKSTRVTQRDSVILCHLPFAICHLPLHRIPIEESIDLHAFHPRDIPSVVDEYLRAAHAAGFVEVRLIHGRGKGVQRGIVQAILEGHALVEAFRDAPDAHLGATIAELVQNPAPGSGIAHPTR